MIPSRETPLLERTTPLGPPRSLCPLCARKVTGARIPTRANTAIATRQAAIRPYSIRLHIAPPFFVLTTASPRSCATGRHGHGGIRIPYRARKRGLGGGLSEFQQHLSRTKLIKSARSASLRVVLYAGIPGPPFRIFSFTVSSLTGCPETSWGRW